MMKTSVGPMEHGSMKPNKPKPTGTGFFNIRVDLSARYSA